MDKVQLTAAVVVLLLLIVILWQAVRLRRLGDLHHIKMPWDVGCGVAEVRLYWPDETGSDGQSREGGFVLTVVPANELMIFLAACERLHINPGINPHSGGECRRPTKITVRKMYGGYPFWWSSPTLSGENGARIFHWEAEEVVWEDKQTPVPASA